MAGIGQNYLYAAIFNLNFHMIQPPGNICNYYKSLCDADEVVLWGILSVIVDTNFMTWS